MNDEEISINENTLKKLLEQKKKMGYDEKSWDEWFDHLTNSKNSPQNEIEKVMEKLYYDKWYGTWIQNFALNLNDIWNESSAKELALTSNNADPNFQNSAIVIGRGPSIKKHKHLELLANSDYDGTIVCCDAALENVLKSGITPDKFPKYFVVGIDPAEEMKKFFVDDIVHKHGNKIKGIFTTVVHPETVLNARKSGIKIHWSHALFDHGEGKKSFNQISALMVRAKHHTDGLPAIQTGGNVGAASWFVSWQILKCSTVALIGINHGWNEDDPWEIITTHGYTSSPPEMDKNNPAFKKLFPKIYNPDFNCYCILDPIFQYYSNALKEFIRRSPSWVTTINATEGGTIFGERISCMKFVDFLKKYKN